MTLQLALQASVALTPAGAPPFIEGRADLATAFVSRDENAPISWIVLMGALGEYNGRVLVDTDPDQGLQVAELKR